MLLLPQQGGEGDFCPYNLRTLLKHLASAQQLGLTALNIWVFHP